jgi:DnaJ domain
MTSHLADHAAFATLCNMIDSMAVNRRKAGFAAGLPANRRASSARLACERLEHVRAFNAGYDYFAGMSPDEISEAQSSVHGWETETRVFRPTAGIDAPPRWSDYADPLEAISARARARMPAARQDGRMITPDERRALDVLGLPLDADRHALRTRYSDLVRRYHPDRNGGDRSHEVRLQAVVEAYQLLRRSAVFA